MTFGLTDGGPVAVLTYDTSYAGLVGQFPHCEALWQTAEESFNDEPALRVLHTGFLSIADLASPASLARCVFRTLGNDPNAADFAVTSIEALNANLETVSVTVAITDLSCEPLAP